MPTPLIPSRKDLRAIYRQGIGDIAHRAGLLYTDRELDAIALEAYPPKMVTQPRVLLGHRIVNGRLQKHFLGGAWADAFSKDTIDLIADLYANPTETVEVD